MLRCPKNVLFAFGLGSKLEESKVNLFLLFYMTGFGFYVAQIPEQAQQ